MLYDNLSVNEKGRLTIGGLDTADLADRFGAPLYVLDEDRVRANCRTYVKALADHMPAGSYPLFAEGALTAARFIVDQKPGFYHMDDLLG